MLLVIYVLILGMKMGICVAHVFCQDSHATDWTPLGYSCPINCAAVITAVKRLQELDYEELITAQQSPFSAKVVNFTAMDFDNKSLEKSHAARDNEEDNLVGINVRRRTNEVEQTELTPSHYIALYKALLDRRVRKELQMVFKFAVKQLKNSTCRYQQNGKCLNTRRSVIQEELLKSFTKIINKHTSSHMFTNRLTAMMLEKLLGNSADLQLGVLDVQKMMKKLRQTITSHKQHARASRNIIILKSKYCLNIYMPGCYCIPGRVFRSSGGAVFKATICISTVGKIVQQLAQISIYSQSTRVGSRTITLRNRYCLNIYTAGCFCITGYVELNGQCVRPVDCFDAPENVAEYLIRISVQ